MDLDLNIAVLCAFMFTLMPGVTVIGVPPSSNQLLAATCFQSWQNVPMWNFNGRMNISVSALKGDSTCLRPKREAEIP